MLRQAVRSIMVILKYARKPTVITLLLRLAQSFETPLSIYFTGRLVNGIASAKLADKIVVLDGGKVTQTGTHAELMLQSGLYKDMFTAQSAWYV